MNFDRLFADIPPSSFWNAPSGSTELLIRVVLTTLIAAVAFFLMRNSGPAGRRAIITLFTFLSGAFYVLLFLWPQPIARHPNQIPNGIAERISFNIDDATPVMGGLADILMGFMLGLGVFSILRVHVGRVLKRQRDWQFSIVLLVCIVFMATFGYWDWNLRKIQPNGFQLATRDHWSFVNYAYDFLFDGLYQQMDAAMFSIIAFFILSAAFRAFRVRSIEATILLGTALIVILSLMAFVEHAWAGAVGMHSQFTLTEIYKWIQNSLQSPALRAIDFGMGIGALAMGLRLWLSLEKQGAN